jgi:hypothetical protein
VKENYEEEYIRSVKETLRQNYETLLGLIKHTTSHDHRHLTARNKKEVEVAMHHVVDAYHLALGSNSLITMRAVDSAFVGALFVGMRCSNPLNVKKYFDNRDHGPGGQKSGVSKRIKTREWQDKAIKWLDGRTGKSLTLKKGVPLAKACKKAIDITIRQKGLAEFFNLELKRRDHANKVVPIRA